MKVSLDDARLAPGKRLYAIGDIHGCLIELNALLDRIRDDLEQRPVEQHRIIFIGDYVDRGPDSKGVITRLIDLRETGQPVQFLRGNHEEKLINAINGMTLEAVDGFARYGGLETLASYGLNDLGHLSSSMKKKHLNRLTDDIAAAVGSEHREFLDNLETSFVEGDYFFCHAGVDPTRSLNDQSEHDLVWMREPFLSHKKRLEKVVVHGHTPRRAVEFRRHRVNVDTGCVYGGTLTALVLEEGEKRLLEVASQTRYLKP
ncbi:MAG: metallophosphoesterase family protein [Pseudomonadota bacterium]